MIRSKGHYRRTVEWRDFVQVIASSNSSVASARAVMGIDWMNKGELNKSIIPTYTPFVRAATLAVLCQN